MNNFTILIKPAPADCNLRCRYCFYFEKQKLYPTTKSHRMSDAVLEQLISGYLTTNKFSYSFGWQGGEPTLMGTRFFKRVTELQRKHARPGSKITNYLQTNATLINDDMAEHFARHGFLIGCSLDGSAETHNRYRKYAGEKPSHKAVMKGIEILRRHGVEFNILTLVSKANVHHARNVYQYLVNKGFTFHQYIPCVEFDADGTPLSCSITGFEWEEFLCEIFDNWYQKDADKVSVRNFDIILSKQLDNINSVCSLADNCCQYFVVEHNGDIYPCDFFVEKNLLIGNVADTTWEEALAARSTGWKMTHEILRSAIYVRGGIIFLSTQNMALHLLEKRYRPIVWALISGNSEHPARKKQQPLAATNRVHAVAKRSTKNAAVGD